MYYIILYLKYYNIVMNLILILILIKFNNYSTGNKHKRRREQGLDKQVTSKGRLIFKVY